MPLKDPVARNAYHREWYRKQAALRAATKPKRKSKARIDLKKRFESKLREDPETGCLLWTAPIVHSSGLPVIGRGGRGGSNVLGNRLALELAGIEVPPGFRVGSTCGNKRCVRVEHLILNAPLGPLADRFWQFVGPLLDSGCIEWTGQKNEHGYGIITGDDGQPKRAHRIALELSGVKIPNGRVVMHSCDNPACVNVAHLSLGTRYENSVDMARKGRGTKGVLPYGVTQNRNGRYQARIGARGHKKCLGAYDTIEAAAVIAKIARDRHYGLIPPEPENPYEGAQWDDYAQ